MSKLRTKVLTFLGGTLGVPLAASACRKCNVTVRRLQGALEFEKETQVLRLELKHAFFASAICEAFDSFAKVLPATERNGKRVVDFTTNPNAVNFARSCLQHGAKLESREGNFWIIKDDRAMILSPGHLVYAVDMARTFDLYFAPLVPHQRDGLRVLDYSQPGILQKYAKSGLEFEMASFPEEEEAIEAYFRHYRPKPGDLVFDMGAHCGVSTYHLAKLVGPEGKVIAFEPDPGNFSILKRNLERHGLENVLPQNMAIAGKTGKLAFNAEGTLGSSLSSLMQRDSVGSTVTVDAITLQDAFIRWGAPAYCKVDIEGAEIEVLESASSVLSGASIHFAFDTHHPRADGTFTDKPVEKILTSYGYEVHSETQPMTTTWAWPGTRPAA